MKVIFISGPFRGRTPWLTEQNIRRAEELSLEAWKLNEEGFEVVVLCTHTNSRFFDKTIDDRYFLDGYLEVLRRCDVMLLTPDWEASEGARDEVKFCDKYEIPVVHSIDQLREWLQLGYPSCVHRAEP